MLSKLRWIYSVFPECTKKMLMWGVTQQQIDSRGTGFQKIYTTCTVNNQRKCSLTKKVFVYYFVLFRGYYPKIQQFKGNFFFKNLRSMKSLHGFMGVFPLCNKTVVFLIKFYNTITINHKNCYQYSSPHFRWFFMTL